MTAARRNAHVLCCPTRWSDVDENGHINNARLVGYIQEGIYDLFHHHAQAVRESLFPAGFLIARHEIDYLAQLHHEPEPLQVRLTVERLGNSSAHVRVDVCREADRYMTARTVVVARDRASGRSRKLSQPERRFLADYMTAKPVTVPAPAPVPASVPASVSVPAQVVAEPRITPKVMPQRRPVRLTVRQPVVAHKVPQPGRSPGRALCRA